MPSFCVRQCAGPKLTAQVLSMKIQLTLGASGLAIDASSCTPAPVTADNRGDWAGPLPEISTINGPETIPTTKPPLKG